MSGQEEQTAAHRVVAILPEGLPGRGAQPLVASLEYAFGEQLWLSGRTPQLSVVSKGVRLDDAEMDARLETMREWLDNDE